jgi:hypothetical protein
MPIVGIFTDSVTRAATTDGIASSTIEKHPARSSATASSISRFAAAAVRPCARRQAEMSHHRNAGIDDAADPRQRASGALELHRVRARLFREPDRVGDGFVLRDLIRPERHVGDDERIRCAATHAAREHDHLVHRDRHRRRAAEHGRARGIPDEDEIHARLIRQPRARRVVRRHHDDAPTLGAHGKQIGERELRAKHEWWF